MDIEGATDAFQHHEGCCCQGDNDDSLFCSFSRGSQSVNHGFYSKRVCSDGEAVKEKKKKKDLAPTPSDHSRKDMVLMLKCS